jgi:hypothetical protein
MSTLTIGPAFKPAAARPKAPRTTAGRTTTRRTPAVRLTRRGRVVFLLAFLTIAAALMVAFGGLATATRDGGTPEPVRIVEVGPGDTLYGIAGGLAEPGQVRQMVHHLEQLNSLTGPQLTVGQRLAVPVS